MAFGIKRRFKEAFDRLRQSHDGPHAVAGGVCIGMFFGFTPLTGLKTLLSLALAWMLKCSRVSAVIAVSLHDVLLPVWPVVLRWEYQIGYWLLTHPHHLPPKLKTVHFHWNEILNRHAIEVLRDTLVGSLIIGIPAAAITYIGVLKMLQRYERTHHRPLKAPP